MSSLAANDLRAQSASPSRKTDQWLLGREQVRFGVGQLSQHTTNRKTWMGLNQQTTGSNGTALHSPGPGTSSHSAGLGFLCCRTIPVGMLVAGDIVRHGSPTVCVDALRTLLDSTCMPKAKSEPPNSWKIIPGLPEKPFQGQRSLRSI